MPQQILIQPAAREYGSHREQNLALAADLEGEGVLVRVLPAVEERGLRSSASQNAGVSYDLTIQVGAIAGEIIGPAKLVEMVRGQLRRYDGREDEKRRGKIYLATGEEHAFVFGDGTTRRTEMHRAVAPSSGSPTDLRRSDWRFLAPPDLGLRRGPMGSQNLKPGLETLALVTAVRATEPFSPLDGASSVPSRVPDR